MQNERPGVAVGCRGRQGESSDRSPGGPGYGADYLNIDPESGAVESSWTAKRRRACMYGPKTPLTLEREHRGRTRDGLQTFADAPRAAVAALSSSEGAQDRTERARIGRTEVILIFDDEVGVGPVVESGGLAMRVNRMTGSGDEGSFVTLEIVGRGLGDHTEVTVAFTEDGVHIIREFLAAVMVVPDSGLVPDVPGLIGKLCTELQDVAVRVASGEQGAEADLFGTSDESVELQWFTE